MIISVGAFLFNVLCALVPCDPKFDSPEIRNIPVRQGDVDRNIQNENVEPIVHLPVGSVEGYIMKSTEGKTFFSFQGIPFGESTAGERRWKPPVPKRPWTGVRKAIKPGPDCLQISIAKLLRVYGDEDCLTVNVYTPTLVNTTGDPPAYPVVVYIHGGSFIMGSGNEHGPTYMLNEDVVLVTINYRLGVLGFLSTGDEVLPGNYGLKDQALALKWIHEFIGYFFGDNSQVTIMGNSAGGVSVGLHLVANKTRNYFTNAFSSSGTAFSFWGLQNNERLKELTSRLAARVGCQSEDSYAMVKCLQRVDSNHLVAQQLNIFDWFPFPPVIFSPTVENEMDPDAFLTVWPEEAYKNNAVANKPYIFGATKDEGKAAMLVLLSMMRMIPLRILWNQIAPYYLQYQHEKGRIEELTNKLNNFYFKGVHPRDASLDVFSDMVTDRYLMFGTIKGLQANKIYNSAPTYFYYFSFSEGNNNLADVIGRKSSEWGASHTEDMYYFFNNTSVYNGQKLSDPDRELSSVMVKLLVNFANTGVPSYTSDSGEVLKIWEPVQDVSKIRALQFDKSVEMVNFPDSDIKRLKFWETLNLPNVTLFSPLTLENEQGSIKLKFLNG